MLILRSTVALMIAVVSALFMTTQAHASTHPLRTCEASYYGTGEWTASGQRFNPRALTAASPSLAFGTRILVMYGKRSVIVRINDRGPYVSGRCLDLSTAAMACLGGLGAGVIRVHYRVV